MSTIPNSTPQPNQPLERLPDRSPLGMWNVRNTLRSACALATPASGARSLNGTSARQVGRQLRDLLRCTTCGKTRVVVNTAGYRQQFVGESVTVESHCSCPGGPAAHLVPASDLCATCGGFGEIDDPAHPGRDADPFTPTGIPCPNPACAGRVR